MAATSHPTQDVPGADVSAARVLGAGQATGFMGH